MKAYFTWNFAQQKFFRVDVETGNIDPKAETNSRYLRKLTERTEELRFSAAGFPADGQDAKAIIGIDVGDPIPATLAAAGFKLIQ